MRQNAIAGTLKALILVAESIFLFAIPGVARSANVTKCSPNHVCYCINADLENAIETKVSHYRDLIADQKRQGKAVGYLSVPLSGSQGGVFNLNREISAEIKKRVENRFGTGSMWILDPATKEADLPAVARQPDYVFMWTEILEGKDGLGQDFDLAYFVGPEDFADFFGFDGHADLGKLDAYFDKRRALDPAMKKAIDDGKLTKATFRTYYGLRASVAFSAGAHDEWNIVRVINQRRRSDSQFGILGQLPMFFNQHAVPSGEFEMSVAPGNAGVCKN